MFMFEYFFFVNVFYRFDVLKDVCKKVMEVVEQVVFQFVVFVIKVFVLFYLIFFCSGFKDWDKLVEDFDYEEDDGVNIFFKKIYKGVMFEQQCVMMKSFIESNGISLSMDWNDVKDRIVKMVLLEGVEVKKWD